MPICPHPQYIAPWRNDAGELASRREIRDSSIRLWRARREVSNGVRTADVEGFSVKETADLLGLSEANVKVRLLRARLALRELLTQTLGDDSARVRPHAHHHCWLRRISHDRVAAAGHVV